MNCSSVGLLEGLHVLGHDHMSCSDRLYHHNRMAHTRYSGSPGVGRNLVEAPNRNLTAGSSRHAHCVAPDNREAHRSVRIRRFFPSHSRRRRHRDLSVHASRSPGQTPSGLGGVS